MRIWKITDLERFRNDGLCSHGLDRAYEVLGEAVAYQSFRDLADVYMREINDIEDVVRAAGLLAPGKIDQWVMARMAFEALPEPLNEYAMTLGPDNWKEAYDCARAWMYEKKPYQGPESDMERKQERASLAIYWAKEASDNSGYINALTHNYSHELAQLTDFVSLVNPGATPRIFAMACNAADGMD
jgi:hypothetical protein